MSDQWADLQEKFWDCNGLFDEVWDEAKRAIRKHGFENTPASNKLNGPSKFVVLAEEVGEVARALTYDEGSAESLREELIQTATMALMWASSLVVEDD